MSPKRLSKQEKARAVADYRGGMSRADVASKYGVVPSSIIKWERDTRKAEGLQKLRAITAPSTGEQLKVRSSSLVVDPRTRIAELEEQVRQLSWERDQALEEAHTYQKIVLALGKAL